MSEVLGVFWAGFERNFRANVLGESVERVLFFAFRSLLLYFWGWGWGWSWGRTGAGVGALGLGRFGLGYSE